MTDKLQKDIESLENCISIQKDFVSGGPYMHGMTNGMILAYSIFSSCEPKYIDRCIKKRKDTQIRHKSQITKLR